MTREEKGTLTDRGGEIVHEIDDDRRIEMIIAEVVIEIFEAGEKIPESAIADGQTVLLTLNGRVGEKTVGKGLLPKRRRINLVRSVDISLTSVLAKHKLS